MASSHFPCDNAKAGDNGCPNPGRFTCKGCFLVSYCGRECQVQDWETHKKWCKSPLMSKDWKPQWEAQGREPKFMSDHTSHATFGGAHYLWGNVPAIDVLQLQKNEGLSYDKDLRILFAASGDPRNVIRTISSVPASYKKHLEVDINDLNLDIVARNAIMLLILLALDDQELAVDTVIHIWYSSTINERHFGVLQNLVLRLFQDVCIKIANKAPGTVLGKTWTVGGRSLRLVLTWGQWLALAAYLHVPTTLTAEKADQIRRRITWAPERLDFRERQYVVQSPAHRLVADRFRQDGLLLPCGAKRDAFIIPNPTIFRASESWRMPDSADPLDGWDSKAVAETDSGSASADQYGKLYYYLRNLLGIFHKRVRASQVSFQLFNVDAKELSEQLKEGAYARVEMSNICDSDYLGFALSMRLMSPLLQTQSANSHATLIMLFMNAVPETITRKDEVAEAKANRSTLMKYLPLPPIIPDQNSPFVISWIVAGHLLRDFDKYFDLYMENKQFEIVGHAYNVGMKMRHTIIEPWPQRLKLKPGQPGAQEEFQRVLASVHIGSDRYVEWKRSTDWELGTSWVDKARNSIHLRLVRSEILVTGCDK